MQYPYGYGLLIRPPGFFPIVAWWTRRIGRKAVRYCFTIAIDRAW